MRYVPGRLYYIKTIIGEYVMEYAGHKPNSCNRFLLLAYDRDDLDPDLIVEIEQGDIIGRHTVHEVQDRELPLYMYLPFKTALYKNRLMTAGGAYVVHFRGISRVTGKVWSPAKL